MFVAIRMSLILENRNRFEARHFRLHFDSIKFNALLNVCSGSIDMLCLKLLHFL